jgi:hypothetical protein
MARKKLGLVLGIGAFLSLASAVSPAQETDNPSIDAGANTVPMQQQNSGTTEDARKRAAAAVPAPTPPAAAQQVPTASQEGVDSQVVAPVRGWIVALLLASLAWTVVYVRTEFLRQKQSGE